MPHQPFPNIVRCKWFDENYDEWFDQYYSDEWFSEQYDKWFDENYNKWFDDNIGNDEQHTQWNEL
jgi:hypothetical protein